MKDVLIIGKTGRLGKEFISQLGAHKVTAIGRSDVDLTQLSHLAFYLRNNPHRVVINCAAFNGMEACLNNPGRAIIHNNAVPAVMASVLAEQRSLFVHFSTDYAITGDAPVTKQTENSDGNPCSIYGFSKRQGEEAVKAYATDYLIFRVASIYGDDLEGSLSPVRNFLAGRKDLSDNKVLHQYTTPTSVRQIVKSTRAAIQAYLKQGGSSFSGLYHLVPEGPVWKHDFGRVALKLYLDEDVPQLLCGQLALPRPVYSLLDNTKFKSTFNITLPTVWEDLYESARLWRRKTGRSPLPPCTQYTPKLA